MAQEPSQELPSCSPFITLNKNAGKNISKEYPPIPRNASENEPQATRLPLWQILSLQVLEHHNKKLDELEKSNNVDVIYLDFAKAFDKVDHGRLLNKLKKIEITGKIGVCIHNFLSNRQQCVAVNGTTSSEAQIRRGLPRETVLGPLLFLKHISDINYEIADSTVSCFADDTRILLGIKDEEDTQMLQNNLHKLYK